MMMNMFNSDNQVQPGRIEKRISTLKERLDAEIDRIPYEAEGESEHPF